MNKSQLHHESHPLLVTVPGLEMRTIDLGKAESMANLPKKKDLSPTHLTKPPDSHKNDVISHHSLNNSDAKAPSQRPTLRRFFGPAPAISPHVFETSFYQESLRTEVAVMPAPLPEETTRILMDEKKRSKKAPLSIINSSDIVSKKEFNIKSCQLSDQSMLMPFDGLLSKYPVLKGSMQV